MITVAGEALMDLIVDPGGQVAARTGGGPFNASRVIARLGQPSAFIGRLSGDRFGQMLRAGLDHDGVRVAVEEPADEPSTLAVADIDPAGGARYSFYLDGTSSAMLDAATARAALPAGTEALLVGTLGLVMEPIATSLEWLMESLPPGVMVVLDPNCRPDAIGSRERYLGRLRGFLRRVDVVKASTDDLAYLCPGTAVEDVAADLLRAGGEGPAGPATVIVTAGPDPVRAFFAGAAAEVRAEVPPVDVVDTVGAGDTFGGAFLAWWIGNGLGVADLRDQALVRDAAAAAAAAAAVTCTRRGADPPWAGEMAGRAGWEWLAASGAARGRAGPGARAPGCC